MRALLGRWCLDVTVCTHGGCRGGRSVGGWSERRDVSPHDPHSPCRARPILDEPTRLCTFEVRRAPVVREERCAGGWPEECLLPRGQKHSGPGGKMLSLPTVPWVLLLPVPTVVHRRSGSPQSCFLQVPCACCAVRHNQAGWLGRLVSWLFLGQSWRPGFIDAMAVQARYRGETRYALDVTRNVHCTLSNGSGCSVA